MKFEFKIEQPGDECCATYFATAREVAKIPHPLGSEEWIQAACRKIKKFGHHEKLSVYQRVKHWIVGFHNKEPTLDSAKFALETIEIKIRTHEDFSSRPDAEIM